VPATSAARNSLLFFSFLLRSFTILMKQSRQAVRIIKQSIFVFRYLWVHYSALFIFLFVWHASAVSLPPSNVTLVPLVCPLSDVMFCLHSGILNLSLYKHWFGIFRQGWWNSGRKLDYWSWDWGFESRFWP
jgi:hypothetical protein